MDVHPVWVPLGLMVCYLALAGYVLARRPSKSKAVRYLLVFCFASAAWNASFALSLAFPQNVVLTEISELRNMTTTSTLYELPHGTPEEVGMSSQRLLQIDAVMQRYIDKGKIQGAVTAVARRGKVVHFRAHGLMDVERERAMEIDSIFRMASSSKPVLGVAAMMAIVPRMPTAAARMSHPSNALPEINALAFVTSSRPSGAIRDMPSHRRSGRRIANLLRRQAIHCRVKKLCAPRWNTVLVTGSSSVRFARVKTANV